VLELQFGIGAKVGGTISLGVGILMLGIFGSCLAEAPLGGMRIDILLFLVAIFLAGGIAFLLSGVYLYRNVGLVRFDRASAELSIRRLVGSAVRPLADVVGVQFISGGMHSSDDGDFETFQINLVLADPRQRRLNVVEATDGPVTRQTAHALAAFLQVPLCE
jgi:hypothetical protein